MDNISVIFNTEDKVELKNAFKEIIKEQFKTQLEDMEMYLFDPNEIDYIIKDAFEEIVRDAKMQFKKDLKEKLTDSINLEKLAKKLSR